MIKKNKSNRNKQLKGGAGWKCYHFTKEDKDWRKQGGKTGRSYTRTQKDMCEKQGDNFFFTKGKNEKYPGCKKMLVL